MIVPTHLSFPFSFSLFLFIYNCGYLEFWSCGWSILGWNLEFIELSWPKSPLFILCALFYLCLLIVCLWCVLTSNYLLFLVLCFAIGGVFSFIYICWWCFCVFTCHLNVDWVRLCFGLVCYLVYMCALFSTFVCCVLFCFVFLCVLAIGCGSKARNKDIMKFTCRGWEVIHPTVHIFMKFFLFLWKFFNSCIVFLDFGDFCASFNWFLVSNGLVANMYKSRICMIEHLPMVWFSIFCNHCRCHVQCCV